MYAINLHEPIDAQITQFVQELSTLRSEEYDILVDPLALEVFFRRAVEEDEYELFIPAQRVYTIVTEEYLDYEIAGIYAGCYKSASTAVEETGVVFYSYRNGDKVLFDWEEDF